MANKPNKELLYDFINDFIKANPMQTIDAIGVMQMIIGELTFAACMHVYEEEHFNDDDLDDFEEDDEFDSLS